MVGQNPTSASSLFYKSIFNPRLALKVLSEWRSLRQAQFSEDEIVDIIADISGEDLSASRAVYREATKEVDKIYDRQFGKHLSPLSAAAIRKKFIGTNKFVRLDRIMLYCLVRLLEPSLVVETGVKWGESSFYILEALNRNDHGELYSFDIGIKQSEYPYPDGVDEVGFLVPEEYSDRWGLFTCDAITGMQQELPTADPVNLFYHDSLHTYDHMWQEFETVLNFMETGGILMSEDIDNNDAWTDFLKNNRDYVTGDYRYYSLHTIDHSNREVGATKVI